MKKSASERRFAKLASELRTLHKDHPVRFQLVWNNYFRGWVQEVGHRMQVQRSHAADAPIPAIFDVFERARGLAHSAEVANDPSVAESLIHLEHVCATAVAAVTNPKLYRFKIDSTYRLRELFVRDRTRD